MMNSLRRPSSIIHSVFVLFVLFVFKWFSYLRSVTGCVCTNPPAVIRMKYSPAGADGAFQIILCDPA